MVQVNDWILTIEKQSFAHCITPVCNFIENVLNVIQENIVNLTDKQICEHCDGIEATWKLQILEVKLADLDRNNDSNSEDGERDAVADEVAASVKVYGIFSTINVKPAAK